MFFTFKQIFKSDVTDHVDYTHTRNVVPVLPLFQLLPEQNQTNIKTSSQAVCFWLSLFEILKLDSRTCILITRVILEKKYWTSLAHPIYCRDRILVRVDNAEQRLHSFKHLRLLSDFHFILHTHYAKHLPKILAVSMRNYLIVSTCRKCKYMYHFKASYTHETISNLKTFLLPHYIPHPQMEGHSSYLYYQRG